MAEFRHSQAIETEMVGKLGMASAHQLYADWPIETLRVPSRMAGRV
jgi:hypothetical protein